MPPQEKPIKPEEVFKEKDRINRISRIRQLIFGTLDGLLVPVGVVSAVAGGTGNPKAVIIAGLAEAFAGALSMGAGEFISGRSEAQVQQMEVKKELQEIRNNPEFEFEEMKELFRIEGINESDSQTIAEILKKYEHAYPKTMVEKELGLDISPDAVKVPEALTMGISYIVGSVFPLIAYFFLPVNVALPVSLVLTIIALIIVGIIKGKIANLKLFSSAAEIVLVGIVSAAGGYILGTLIPRIFGV